MRLRTLTDFIPTTCLAAMGCALSKMDLTDSLMLEAARSADYAVTARGCSDSLAFPLSIVVANSRSNAAPSPR
jgi:hypothetical protein